MIGREKEADAEGCLKREDAGNRLPLTRRMMCRISTGANALSRTEGKETGSCVGNQIALSQQARGALCLF